MNQNLGISIFPLVIIGIVVILAVFNWEKTWSGVKKGISMFISILPTFLTVLVLVSVFLYLVPESMIKNYLGQSSGWQGLLLGSAIGSVALIPAFVAAPLASVILKEGASILSVSAFITTLMMVGVITLPVEFRYLGKRAALWRNFLSLVGAIIVALLMGVTYARLP
jgi:uncharacterized membrane protein YraQ (UPF0718 family)